MAVTISPEGQSGTALAILYLEGESGTVVNISPEGAMPGQLGEVWRSWGKAWAFLQEYFLGKVCTTPGKAWAKKWGSEWSPQSFY